MFSNTSTTMDNSNGSNLLASNANTSHMATTTTIGVSSSANALDDIGGSGGGDEPGADRIKLLYPNVNEAETPLPRCWSPGEKCINITLSQNNLRVQYRTPLLVNNKTQEPASVRTAHPIPPSCGIYYFEVKIISKSKNGYMGIGLTAQQFRMNRLPGCDRQSFGYHGAEGNSFASSGHGQSYGPTFTTGDIIGCCVNFVNNTCFYTKNGIDLGIAFRDLPKKLYPTVGLQAPGEEVDVNFGQEPFKFDQIEEMMKQMRTETSATIRDFPLTSDESDPITLLQKLVSSYLVHNGYSDTAEAFSRCTGQTFQEDISSIRNRQKIIKLVMSGKMSQAIEQTLLSYPGLLENNKNLWFMLKCRQFIEMINGSDVEYCSNKKPTAPTNLNNNNSNNNSSSSNSNKRSNGVSGDSACLSANHNSNSQDQEMNSLNSQQQHNELLSTLMSPSSQVALPQQTSVIQSTKLYQNGGNSTNGDGGAGGDSHASSSNNCHNSKGMSTCKNQPEEIIGDHVVSSPLTSHSSHHTPNIEDISDINMPIPATIATDTADAIATTITAVSTTVTATTTEASIIMQTTLATTATNKYNNTNDNINNTTNGNDNNNTQNSTYTAVIDMDITNDILKSETTNLNENASTFNEARNNITNANSSQCHNTDNSVNEENDNGGVIGEDDENDHADFYDDIEMDQTTALPTNGTMCKNNGNTSNFNDSMENDEDMDVDVAVLPPRKYTNGIERILQFGKDLSKMGQQLERENKMTDDDRQMLEDAFSLIAYSNPWSSPLGWQLCPSRREPVAAALNSAILESMYCPRRPPLDYCVAHANELLKVMAKSSMGASAFVSIKDVFPKD